jgi:hypothetical protein
MGLKSTLAKVLKAGGAVDKVVRQLDEARPAQAATFSTSANARRAIEEAIAAATPTLAPSITFVAHGGYAPLSVAYDGRFRRFKVEVASFARGQTARGAQSTPYNGAITLDVSYPDRDTIEVEGVVYSVEDLQVSDVELVDRIVRPAPGGSILPAGFEVLPPTSGFDAGNTIHRTRWEVTWRQARA